MTLLFTINFQSLKLSFQDQEKCDIAGWGYKFASIDIFHKNQSNYNGELQEAQVPIVELERCAKIRKDFKDDPVVTNKTICAGGLNTKDACVVCTICSTNIQSYIPYSREQKHVLLFRKPKILLFKVSITNILEYFFINKTFLFLRIES